MTPNLRHAPFAALAGPVGHRPSGADDPDPRADLQATQMALDRAVAEVSRPSVHFVLGGREATRAYRLKGVGAFFVLPPRALPTGDRDRVFVFDRRRPRARGPEALEGTGARASSACRCRSKRCTAMPRP